MENQRQQIFGKRSKENKKPIQVTLGEMETIKGQNGILKVYLNKTRTRCFKKKVRKQGRILVNSHYLLITYIQGPIKYKPT